MTETITLEFLGQRLDHLTDAIHSMREDMAVMMTILQRLDQRMNALETAVQLIGTQLTDMHVYNRRVEARVFKIEERGP
jgi:hypothetical protein